MTFLRTVRRLLAGAFLCSCPALFAQPFLYQLSIPAVTTGSVQTAAVSLQFVAPPLMLAGPPAQPLNLVQQPNFALTGNPQPGYSLSSGVLFGGTYAFGLVFQNAAGLQIVYQLTAIPPVTLNVAGAYLFGGSASMFPAGGGAATVGSQVIATLTVSIAPPPILIKSVPAITLVSAPAGGPPIRETVLITSSSSPLSFSASVVNTPWLTVTASSATTPATLNVVANPAGLPEGLYTGSIQLSAPGAANPVDSIFVSLTIRGLLINIPLVTQISNSASYAPAGAPNGGIAQGSLFVIFGYGLGQTSLTQSGYPLSANLSGTSIKVTVGFTSTDALVLYTSSRQVAAILPSRTSAGTGSLVVTYNGAISSSMPITVVPSSFGTYTVASNGLGPGIITGADYGLKTSSSPARPGETVILWGTGLGAITGDESKPPTPANQFSPLVLLGNSAQAKVSYAGRSSCCSGLDQINFVVPPGIEGCFVPVSVQIGGVPSNFTSVPIASSGACVQPPGFPSSLVDSAMRGSAIKVGVIAVGPIPVLQSFRFPFNQTAALAIERIVGRKVDPADLRTLVQAQRGTQTEQRAYLAQMMKKYGVGSVGQARRLQTQLRALLGNDSQGAIAAFGGFSGVGSFAAQLLGDFPPSGNCTAFPYLPATAGGASSPGALDAGAQLALSTPVGNKTLTRWKTGEYSVLFGSGFTMSQAPAGTYRVSGSGGKDIGIFSASLNVSSSLRWLNQSATGTVDRSQPLTVTWSGGPNPGHIVFGGFADAAGGAFFVCVEDAQKGSLTVPPQALSILPATAGHRGYLFLAIDPFENPFAAPGLDAGYFMNFSNDSREVEFR